MSTWKQIAALVIGAALLVLILGPLVGAVELSIMLGLVAVGIALILRRARQRSEVSAS